MTSRTPPSLETGFAGVLFIESWISPTILSTSATEAVEHGAPAPAQGASFRSDIVEMVGGNAFEKTGETNALIDASTTRHAQRRHEQTRESRISQRRTALSHSSRSSAATTTKPAP
jgi:hypothetical protein